MMMAVREGCRRWRGGMEGWPDRNLAGWGRNRRAMQAGGGSRRGRGDVERCLVSAGGEEGVPVDACVGTAAGGGRCGLFELRWMGMEGGQ